MVEENSLTNKIKLSPLSLSNKFGLIELSSLAMMLATEVQLDVVIEAAQDSFSKINSFI